MPREVTPCHCGAECAWPDIDGPCWGEVHTVDEDGNGWIHACEGHAGFVYGEPYESDPSLPGDDG